MIIPIFIIGLVSSIITELLKAFPKLKESKERQRLVAFVVSLLIAGGYILSFESGIESIWIFLGMTVSATFVIYQSVVKTIRLAFFPVK